MLWLVFLAVVGLATGLGSRENHVFLGDDEADIYLLLPRLYKLLPELYGAVSDKFPADRGLALDNSLQDLYNEIEAMNHTQPSGDCVACRALVSLLEEILTEGTYEEIEETFMDLCYIVTNASDDLGIPEYICPGITENYLADAIYVLNNTAMDTIEICLLWNECIYSDFDPHYPENETLVCKPPVIPESVSRDPTPTHRHTPSDLEDAIKVVHMTDIHVDGWYEVGAPTLCGMPTCCRNTWPGEGQAGYWGDYLCNQPLRITDLMLSYMATLAPHYIMYTGDNPPHTPWSDTYESQLNMSVVLVNSFTANIPGVRVLPALGNHDIAPVNLYFNEKQAVKDGNMDLSNLWETLAGFGPEEMQTFQYAAYYTTLLQPGLRVITYNSNYGFLENFYTMLPDRHPDYEQMKVWMETELNNARQNGEKVILLGHHPTGQSQGNNVYSCFITDVHARYGDIIMLHLSGHKHGDLFRLVRDIETGETKGAQISSAAGGTRTNRNPSFRVFYLDPVTYDVLDSDVYRVNMTSHLGDLDGNPVPTVDFGYRFTDYYNVTDMSPSSMEDLVLRFWDDAELFDRYLLNYESGNPDEVDDCDDDCREHEVCELMNTAYPGYLVCRGKI